MKTMTINFGLAAFWRDRNGAAVVEMAIALPILLALSLGGFDASQVVARNTELQTALAEAEAVTLAKLPENQGEVDTIEDIVEASTGLADDKVTFTRMYRCDTDAEMVEEFTDCAAGSIVAEFLEITVTDSYEPIWAEFGIGSTVNFNFTRTVQIA